MNEYPGTNFHDLNLDWLLDQMTQLREEWDEFRSHYPPYDSESPAETDGPDEEETTANDEGEGS